jgi:hypothetical protein
MCSALRFFRCARISPFFKEKKNVTLLLATLCVSRERLYAIAVASAATIVGSFPVAKPINLSAVFFDDDVALRVLHRNLRMRFCHRTSVTPRPDCFLTQQFRSRTGLR